MQFVSRFVENRRKFGHVNSDSWSSSAANDKKMIKHYFLLKRAKEELLLLKSSPLPRHCVVISCTRSQSC